MNETLSTLAAYTADRRAEAAADLVEHGGEKDHYPAMQEAIKNLVGSDHGKLKKYTGYEDTNEYPKKYRAGLWRYWAKLPENEKLKILALEAPTLKILSGYKTGMEEEKIRLSARAIAVDLYRQLNNPKSSTSKAIEANSKDKDQQEVLLNTLFSEVERLRREGYDFEQIAGIMRGITKGRLKTPANKIANEYYRRHPSEKKQTKKTAPM